MGFHPKKSEVQEGRVLGSVIFLIFIHDIPRNKWIVDDTIIMATHDDPEMELLNLKDHSFEN